jgi:hypothetical protein
MGPPLQRVEGSAFLLVIPPLLWLQVKVKVNIVTDGQSISKSWYRAPSGAHDQIFITL